MISNMEIPWEAMLWEVAMAGAYERRKSGTETAKDSVILEAYEKLTSERA
jgi:hypothetical protein